MQNGPDTSQRAIGYNSEVCGPDSLSWLLTVRDVGMTKARNKITYLFFVESSRHTQCCIADMGSRFSQTDLSSLADGTFSINVSSAIIQTLAPSLPVRN